MQLPRLAAVFLAAMLSAPAAEKPVHLFILSGQSNMAGMKPEAGFLPEAKTLFADAEVAFIKVAKGLRRGITSSGIGSTAQAWEDG